MEDLIYVICFGCFCSKAKNVDSNVIGNIENQLCLDIGNKT
jgi:hypothetical protein